MSSSRRVWKKSPPAHTYRMPKAESRSGHSSRCAAGASERQYIVLLNSMHGYLVTERGKHTPGGHRSTTSCQTAFTCGALVFITPITHCVTRKHVIKNLRSVMTEATPGQFLFWLASIFSRDYFAIFSIKIATVCEHCLT